MRVAIVGNAANSGFWYTRALREAGVDVDLYLPSKPDGRGSVKPFITEDPVVSQESDELPRWIIPWVTRPYWRLPLSLVEWKRYDLIHAFTLYSILVQFAGRPFIVHSMGTDLREYAYQGGLGPALWRRSLARARQILAHNIDDELIHSARRMGLPTPTYIPQAIDPQLYHPKITTGDGQVPERPFCLFSPSRLDWHIKGTPILLEGFALFLKEVGAARLILSAWGDDVDETHLMIRDLGLSDVTTLLPPQRRGELIRLYHQADSVVSHFVGRGMGVHHFTMVSFEAMACGLPVICSMHDDMYMRGFGSTPPMLEASTPREIADHLLALYRDESLRTRLGRLGRQWVLDHHRPELIAPKLIDIYERALKGAS